MATTKKQQTEDQAKFAEAFNEKDAEKPAQTEDQAFGIQPESGDDGPDGIEGAPPLEVIAIAAPEGGDAAAEPPGVEAAEPAAEEATETPAQEAAEQAPAAAPEVGEDWEQKYKTLQGKYNAEIANKGGVQPSEEESGKINGQPDGEADKPGGLTAEEAVAKLSEDFGPDFVQMISTIATSIAEKAAMEVANQTVQVVDQDVKSIIAHLTDQAQQAHFQHIHGEHPDFMDIASSPEFEAWLKTRPPEEQAKDAQILSTGKAADVVGILNQYKAATKAAPPEETPPPDDGSADAAEGVRSARAQLPAAPAPGSDDYEAAWNQA